MATIDQQLAGPQYWDQNLPQPTDYDTMQAYLDAVKAFQQAQPWNAPAFHQVPDMSSMGPGWHGYNVPGGTIGQIAAHNVNQAYAADFQPGVKTAHGLALASRNKLHPDEFANAYNAFYIDPKSGLPHSYLNDDVLVALENLGYRHPVPPIPMTSDPNYVRDEAARRQAVIDQYQGGGAAQNPMTSDPNYVRDEAARRQAVIDQYQGGGGSQSGPVERPGANDPVRRAASPAGAGVQPDQSGPGGPVERPRPEFSQAALDAGVDPHHDYPPDFLRALARLRRPMAGNLGY